jgi:hypothetical protein
LRCTIEPATSANCTMKTHLSNRVANETR